MVTIMYNNVTYVITAEEYEKETMEKLEKVQNHIK